jgi:lysophospholipase L1-like esterase
MAKRILFQGDSITDAGRNREDFHSLGYGYPLLVAAHLTAEYPGEYEYVNRGVGGDLLADLYNRRQADLLDLAPDYLSLFIGTNDAWAELDQGRPIVTDAFEQMYTDLLEEIFATYPDTKVMLISPAIMEGLFSRNTEEQPDRLNQFRFHVASRIEAVRQVAAKYDLPFVDMQAVYDAACERAEAAVWTGDGAHPTAGGHELIKRAWLAAFEKFKER